MSNAQPEAKQIFLEALDRDSPEEILSFIDQACGNDLELRKRVDALLKAHQDVGQFLGGPPPATATADTDAIQGIDRMIGPYKLLQQIGEGGMGVVFLAEQKEPVKRRVALKIIKPGMDSRQVLARFEAERQALALMDHPNIAKVFDGGQTDSGQPYFVMELVNGLPLTQYCDEHRLTPQERLKMFISVCHAVQHAHQKGIIHRDLKPSNILVAEYDDIAMPKVIDFGVAKATSQALTDKTMFTQFGQLVGTFEYMSPEQAKRNQLDVDTRSDVYSLGVVLYELLTGDTPFDRKRLRSAAIDELMRIIRDELPPKPSTKLASAVTLPAVAANRKIEPAKLRTAVQGDLDWIAMKALEKDRSRRYETASALAADLHRFLLGDPIEARPPSTVYRLRKAAKRHRAALAAVSTVALVLVLATAISSFLAAAFYRANRIANEARFRALELAMIAEDQKKEAEYQQQVAEDRSRALQKQLFAASICNAWNAIGENHLDAAKRYVSKIDPRRTFDGRYIWSRCRQVDSVGKQLPHAANSVAFSADGVRLAVSDTKGHITVWDIADPASLSLVHEIKCDYGLDEIGRSERYYTPIAYSPTDDMIAFMDDDSKVVRLFDLQSHTDHSLRGHRGVLTGLDFSPDGKQLASVDESGLCMFWNVEQGTPGKSLEMPEEDIRSVRYAPDGKTIAMGTRSGVIAIWDLETEKCVRMKCTPVRAKAFEYATESEWIWQLSYSSDGSQLAAASGDATIKLFDLESHEQYILSGHNDQVRGVSFACDDAVLLSGCRDGTVKVWDVSTKMEIRNLNGHATGVRQLDVCGAQMATAGGDGSFRIWTLDGLTKENLCKLTDGHKTQYAHSLAFMPDGRHVVVLTGTLTTPSKIQLLDLPTGGLVDLVSSGKVAKMAMSCKGVLATIQNDGDILIYELGNDVEAKPHEINCSGASCLSFDKNGARLIIGFVDGRVEFWDVDKRDVQKAFSVGNERVSLIEIGQERLLVKTRDRIASWHLASLTAEHPNLVENVGAVAFSSDANLAAYTKEGKLVVVDLSDSRQIAQQSVQAGLRSLRFIDDGQTLVTTDWYGHVRFWNIDPLQERMSFVQNPRRNTCVAISPDGNMLAVGGDGGIRWYDASEK